MTDISQRSAIEQELRSSEANLRVAEQIALLGSWRWDVLRDSTTWSSGMYVLTGMPLGTPRPLRSRRSSLPPTAITACVKPPAAP